MAHYGNALAIDSADPYTLVNRRLRTGDELLDVGIVRFGLALADDWDGGAFQHRHSPGSRTE